MAVESTGAGEGRPICAAPEARRIRGRPAAAGGPAYSS